MNFEKSDRNQVKRIPQRGRYDRKTIYEILDAAYVCHVGFVVDGQPFVIPTLYGRDGDVIYLHGSAASRMMKNLAAGTSVCLTVTHCDALVLARSAFHHSMNYRSAMVFGKAVQVEGEEKLKGLYCLSEQVIEGRWEEVRGPTGKELKATTVLRVDIEDASAKIRTGPPSDEPEDYELRIWAGVVPIQQTYGAAVADEKLNDGIEVSASVRAIAGS